MTLPVIGPLWQPASNSGVHFPSCTHVAPQSCERCDGTYASGYDDHAAIPPCMRKEPAA